MPAGLFHRPVLPDLGGACATFWGGDYVAECLTGGYNIRIDFLS